MDVAGIVFIAIDGPALELLPDIKRERINRLWRHFPPFPGAARAQIRRHVNGQVARRIPPADPHDQGYQQQSACAQAQGLDMRLQMGDLVLEPAHEAALRLVVQ